MKDLKITKGEWKATQTEKVDSHLDIAINANDYCVAWVYSDSSITNKGDECIANAQLIADAGTTANKCGLFPSELLRQRNEMIKQLAYIQECCEVNAEDSKGIDKKVYLELADIAEKAINNTKVGKVELTQ